MRRLILLLLVLCLHGLARGQTGGYSGYYWFDGQPGKPQTSPVVQGSFDVDASALADGIHTFHYLVAKDGGGISLPAIQYFVRPSEANTAIKGYYWFDDETDARESSVINGTFEVDVSLLSDGFHRFYYMAMQENGVTSVPSTCYFLKTAQVNPNDELTCICSVDGQLRHIEKLSQQGGIIHWNLDMQDLADGVHQIQLQAVTSSGAVSTSYNSYFMRVTSIQDLNEMYCVYAIDGNSLNSKSNVVSNGGSFHFDLDLSELEEGLHYISFMLHSDRGTSTKPQTRFFIKTPLGGNVITQYQYWLNEDSIEQATTVKLSEKVSPLQLMTLLPVESRPLRSSLFHFDTSNGTPMIYAKNTIHLRFFDAAMRFSDVAKDYTDFSVGQEVKPVGELQSTQTFPKVAENDIRWYTMHSAPGDTAAFRLSQPATMQVFAPSGAEVFKTSESASVKWNGIHTWEEGTYYLAVHDVTGSKENMTLEYMHMDKYDVVDWDVHTVGNGGCSTITFKGNGFRDLYAVDLVVAPGDTIRSVDVSHDSDAETAIAFDFTDATLGDYNAVFHFTEEDKHIANVVTVEEAVDIELATDVSFPSSFFRGTSTTYTIKITNKGNMTAYRVPIYTWMKTKSQDGISHINYEGLGLAGLFDNIETDSLSASDIAELKAHSTSTGDDHYFLKFWAKDEESISDSIFVRSNYFFTTIAPYETKTLRLTISAKEEVFSYFTVPKNWPSFDTVGVPEGVNAARARFKGPSMKDQYCCIRSRVECIASITADVVGIANKVSDIWAPGTPADIALGVANCLADALNQLVSATGTIMCGDDSNDEDKLWEKVKAISNGLSIANTLSGCASKLLPAGKLKTLLDAINNITEGEGWLTGLGIGIDFEGCKEAFSTPIPGCPPDPDGGGGPSNPQLPSDPNDIFGYLSQAGSKFIADSVARVNYTIEFENDTTFAEAAAHTIVIKDTLDSRYFDLAKFMPTGIRIGEHETFLDEADVVTRNNVTSFVKTIDMRPEIYAIAQVNGTFSHTTGIAEWRFTSLDPMTMEPTDDLIQGILPVNYNGTSGIGEVMFEIGVKQGKADGTELKNRAGIVFDYEAPILTPTWTNIVDAVTPSSVINNSWMANDSTLRVTADASDARSGVWKYEWYVQAGENAPWWKEGETYSPQFDYHIYEGIDYGFCVLATDSAGNVEQKVIERERGFKTYGPDYEDTVSPLPTSSEEEGPAYDLSGRQIVNGKSSNSKYRKGIIIRNRRKTLVTE